MLPKRTGPRKQGADVIDSCYTPPALGLRLNMQKNTAFVASPPDQAVGTAAAFIISTCSSSSTLANNKADAANNL